MVLDGPETSIATTGSGGGSSSGATGAGGDGGWGGAGSSGGSSFSPCTSSQDCWGAETCQQGLCCAGVYANGACTCGAEPECDLSHICCKPKGSDPNMGLTCVPAALAMGECAGPF